MLEETSYFNKVIISNTDKSTHFLSLPWSLICLCSVHFNCFLNLLQINSLDWCRLLDAGNKLYKFALKDVKSTNSGSLLWEQVPGKIITETTLCPLLQGGSGILKLLQQPAPKASNHSQQQQQFELISYRSYRPGNLFASVAREKEKKQKYWIPVKCWTRAKLPPHCIAFRMAIQ